MEKPRLWNYKTGAKARHLRTKAKEYLSYKLTMYWEQKRFEKEFKNKEFTYHIKLSYKSDRDKAHDFMTEFTLTIIKSEEMPEEELKDFIVNHLEELADGEDFLLGIPFNNVEIGLSNVEEIGYLPEQHHFTQTKFSHTLI